MEFDRSINGRSIVHWRLTRFHQIYFKFTKLLFATLRSDWQDKIWASMSYNFYAVITGWRKIYIHGCYSLLAEYQLWASKHNWQIWRHNNPRLRDVKGELWWRHNANSTLIRWCPQTYMDRQPGLEGPGPFWSVLNIYTPAQRSWRGGGVYWIHLVRLSVCPSVCL